MPRLGVLQATKNALSVGFQNLGLLLLLSILVGGLGDAGSFFLAEKAAAAFLESTQIAVGPTATQVKAVTFSLMVTAFQVLWYGPLGAFAAAATLYLWVQREKGKPTNLYEAINFGLNRWGRVLKAHWLALLFIQLGGIIIIGAVLLGLQYAFVDSIATLDDREKAPLARSRKLTLGRRGTIFYTFLLFTPWFLFYSLGLTFLLPQQGTLVQFGAGVGNQFVLCLIDLVMVQYYLDLFRKPAAAAAPAEAPAGAT